VGRGAALDLGIAPDTRGLLDDEDVKSLEGFGKLVAESFRNNLAQAATLRVSNKRSKSYKGMFVLDGIIDSYWATQDTVKSAVINLTWSSDQTFDLIKMREYIPLGQRIDSVEVDAMINGNWTKVAAATSIGACRIIQLSEPVKTAQLRFRISAPVCIAMSELGVYKKASL
jgi:alpha-L-fucosidase